MPDTLTPPPAEAVAGHNSAAVGEMIKDDPAVIFREPDMVDALLAEIEAEIDQATPDVSTRKGRDLIAGAAYAISKTKTAIDAAGKELNEDHRAAIQKVDAVRKKIRDGLDALRDKARKPLTDWEAEEEARRQRVSDAHAALTNAARPQAGAGSAEIAGNIELVENLKVTEALYGDRAEEIEFVRGRVLEGLRAAHASVVKAEEAQAELARIKAENEAKERAEAEAREKAEAEAAEARRAEAERKRQEDERKVAEERAAASARAEAEAKAEAEREKDRKAAQAKIDAAEAERKAAAEALAKKEREEAEAKARADAEAKAAARRAADNAHRERVLADAVDALIRHTSLSDDQARSAILAIAAGQVPAVTITF